jgi:hypothetical protein
MAMREFTTPKRPPAAQVAPIIRQMHASLLSLYGGHKKIDVSATGNGGLSWGVDSAALGTQEGFRPHARWEADNRGSSAPQTSCRHASW